METLIAPLQEIGEYQELRVALDRGQTPVQVSGLSGATRSQFIASFFEEAPVRLIITHDEIRGAELVEDLRLYDPDVLYYPPKDLIFFSADVHGQTITDERLAVIRRLRQTVSEKKSDQAVGPGTITIVTTIDGGMDSCLPFSYYQQYEMTLRNGDACDLTELSERLVEMGYDSAGQVEREGEFSIRGGIMDIFPATEETAFRIELWGDEIDSIRSIDVESQRSIETVKEITITPATEIMLTEEQALAGLHRITQEAEERIRTLRDDGRGEAAGRLKSHIDSFRDTFEAYHGLVNLESYIRYFAPEEPVSF
ncbi:MAG: transcription-repair coupling factor, partial [Eubacterium sp.]|nr:transcription-repair coupling factor [Eubacterium sp.]